MSTVFLGQLACLSAAMCWAIAVTWFRSAIAEYGAQAVNLAKTSIAASLLAITMVALGQVSTLAEASTSALFWTGASGLIGMSLGDTALFSAVHRIGVHRTLLLQTLAPVSTAAFAIGFTGESLGWHQFAGTGLVLAGVMLVVGHKRPAANPAVQLDDAPQPATSVESVQSERGEGPSRIDSAGVGLALLAAVSQGSGVVMAKTGMIELPFVTASFLRLATAVFGIAVALAFAGKLRQASRVLTERRTLARIAPPSILGTYIAILFMMAGIALAPASIASVLLSTSPVFSLFIDARITKTPISPRAALGTALAVAGVGLLAAFG